MDKQQLSNSLKKTIRSLQRLVDELDADVQDEEIAEKPDSYSTTCGVCGKPILPTDTLKRGVHETCYQSVYQQFIRTGLKTADELEAAGVLGPKAKVGRKPVRDFDELARRAQARIDSDRDKKK